MSLADPKRSRYIRNKKCEYSIHFLCVFTNLQIRYLLLLTLFGCSARDEIYPVVGTIHSIDLDEKKVVIAHDTIPELMNPMVMPFPFLHDDDVKGLEIGDSVNFELVWDDVLPHARKFKVVGTGNLLDYDDFFDDEYTPKQIGQIIDNAAFLNLDGEDVSLSDFDGTYRFISFIFTRCPMPNMCPAVVMKNNTLANRFPNINFILVSFDYKYDTPEVLKSYYGNVVEGIQNCKVWSSSGNVENVYKLIRQSGGNFWGVETNKIGHTLSSILIDDERKLLANWTGEDWTVLEVSRAVELLMKK